MDAHRLIATSACWPRTSSSNSHELHGDLDPAHLEHLHVGAVHAVVARPVLIYSGGSVTHALAGGTPPQLLLALVEATCRLRGRPALLHAGPIRRMLASALA